MPLPAQNLYRSEPVGDNPAARLLAFVQAFRAIPGPRDANRTTVGEAIGYILEADLSLRADLHREVALIVDLPRQARSAIEQRPEAIPPRFAHELQAVENWLRFLNNLDQPCVGPARSLADDAVKALEMCAELLSLNAPEQVATPDVLQVLRDDANDLIEQVLATGLHPDLATLLVDHLHLIIKALDDYRLSGAQATRAASDQAFGAIGRARAMGQVDEKGAKWSDMVWQYVGRVANLAVIGQAAIDAGHVLGQLGAPPHAQ
ncbi:MAG: hypothetical protein M0010_02545 [Actinomycetota bacterium]|nr:hypothetical protein [Actinomycetota bacterium]